jgi:hypothetical protein
MLSPPPQTKSKTQNIKQNLNPRQVLIKPWLKYINPGFSLTLG